MSSVDLITLEPDHEALALRDFYSQFRHDPVMRAFFVACCRAFQIFEEMVVNLIVSTGLHFATGEELEFWGELVGEARGALFDDEYRLIILGRIAARQSQGSPPELIALFEAITESLQVRLWESYPAGFVLETQREAAMRDEYRTRVRLVMQDAKKAGVGMLLVESIVGASIEYDDAPGYDEGEWSEII